MPPGTGGWVNSRAPAPCWYGVWPTCCGVGWPRPATVSGVLGSEVGCRPRVVLGERAAAARQSSAPPGRPRRLPHHPTPAPTAQPVHVETTLQVVVLVLQAPREPPRAVHQHRLPVHGET